MPREPWSQTPLRIHEERDGQTGICWTAFMYFCAFVIRRPSLSIQAGVGSPACRSRCFGQQLVGRQKERFRPTARIRQPEHVQDGRADR